MPRLKGVNVEKEILDLLSDGKPRSLRQIQRELNREWYAVYYHIKEKEGNLIERGCVEPIKTRGELKHVAQDEYVYRITPKGLAGCPVERR